jgi:hypothetical protein
VFIATAEPGAASLKHRRDADDFAAGMAAHRAEKSNDGLSQDNPSDADIIGAAQAAAHRLITGQS